MFNKGAHFVFQTSQHQILGANLPSGFQKHSVYFFWMYQVRLERHLLHKQFNAFQNHVGNFSQLFLLSQLQLKYFTTDAQLNPSWKYQSQFTLKSPATSALILHLADRLKQTALIIWDEIVRTHRHKIDSFDQTLRNLCLSTFPFKGIPILFIGNSRKILPVSQAANWHQIVSVCFKRLLLFFLCTSLHPHSNMRLPALKSDPYATPDAFCFHLICFDLANESCNKMR